MFLLSVLQLQSMQQWRTSEQVNCYHATHGRYNNRIIYTPESSDNCAHNVAFAIASKSASLVHKQNAKWIQAEAGATLANEAWAECRNLVNYIIFNLSPRRVNASSAAPASVVRATRNCGSDGRSCKCFVRFTMQRHPWFYTLMGSTGSCMRARCYQSGGRPMLRNADKYFVSNAYDRLSERRIDDGESCKRPIHTMPMPTKTTIVCGQVIRCSFKNVIFTRREFT